MKKIISLLFIITILTMCFVSCDGNNDNNSNTNNLDSNTPEEITLTTENFKDYFNVVIEATSTNVTPSAGIVKTYSANANLSIRITPKVPLTCYNASANIEVETGRTFWNKNSATVSLSYDGTGSSSTSLKTLSKSECNYVIVSEGDCYPSFYSNILNVKGTITLE